MMFDFNLALSLLFFAFSDFALDREDARAGTTDGSASLAIGTDRFSVDANKGTKFWGSTTSGLVGANAKSIFISLGKSEEGNSVCTSDQSQKSDSSCMPNSGMVRNNVNNNFFMSQFPFQVDLITVFVCIFFYAATVRFANWLQSHIDYGDMIFLLSVRVYA